MNKTIVLMLALVFLIGLCGCKNNDGFEDYVPWWAFNTASEE